MNRIFHCRGNWLWNCRSIRENFSSCLILFFWCIEDGCWSVLIEKDIIKKSHKEKSNVRLYPIISKKNLQKKHNFLYFLYFLPLYIMDFKQAQELMKLQQQAQKIQEELSNTHIEAESSGVVVTIDGQLKVVSVVIEDPTILSNKENLEKAIMEATNKWMKKAQEVAADRMRGVMGQMGLNIPGM